MFTTKMALKKWYSNLLNKPKFMVIRNSKILWVTLCTKKTLLFNLLTLTSFVCPIKRAFISQKLKPIRWSLATWRLIRCKTLLKSVSRCVSMSSTPKLRCLHCVPKIKQWLTSGFARSSKPWENPARHKEKPLPVWKSRWKKILWNLSSSCHWQVPTVKVTGTTPEKERNGSAIALQVRNKVL